MLLDSNILIYAASPLYPEIGEVVASEKSCVASIVQIEIYGYPRLKKEEKSALDIIFKRLLIYPLTPSIIDKAIALRQQRKMGLADSIIAATALIHGLQLVTRNVDDYKNISGLRLLNPFEDNDRA